MIVVIWILLILSLLLAPFSYVINPEHPLGERQLRLANSFTFIAIALILLLKL